MYSYIKYAIIKANRTGRLKKMGKKKISDKRKKKKRGDPNSCCFCEKFASMYGGLVWINNKEDNFIAQAHLDCLYDQSPALRNIKEYTEIDLANSCSFCDVQVKASDVYFHMQRFTGTFNNSFSRFCSPCFEAMAGKDFV